MKRPGGSRVRVGILSFLLALLADRPGRAQEAEPLPSVELPPALARVLTDYEVAWQNKDAAALAALFAEDGFVLSSGVPPVRGRAQIQKHYTGQGGPLSLRALAFATGRHARLDRGRTTRRSPTSRPRQGVTADLAASLGLKDVKGGLIPLSRKGAPLFLSEPLI